MQKTDLDSLQRFLTINAKKPELVPPSMELIRPLLAIADSGRYPLCRAEELDMKETAEAIALATGRPVYRVIPFSLSRPFPKPEWMIERVYRANLRVSIESNLACSLGMYLAASSPALGLGIVLAPDLASSLKGHLKNLVPSLGENLAGYDRRAEDSIEASLFFFLGSAIVDGTEWVERLTPLIRHLPKAIPLGTSADDTNDWLVLVA